MAKGFKHRRRTVYTLYMATLFTRREQRHIALFGAVVAVCLLVLFSTYSGDWRISTPRLRMLQWSSELGCASGLEDENNGQKTAARPPEIHPWEVETTAPMVTYRDTKIGAHTWGFNVLDNIYLRNGTFYIVTNDRDSVPPKEEIIHRLGRLSTHDDQDDEGSEVRSY